MDSLFLLFLQCYEGITNNYVSILILMDSLFLLIRFLLSYFNTIGLNPYFNGFTILTIRRLCRLEISFWRLNPYFNGFTILTLIVLGQNRKNNNGLNPYFNGFTILTYFVVITKDSNGDVSILILMDSLFLHSKIMSIGNILLTSQSLF